MSYKTTAIRHLDSTENRLEKLISAMQNVRNPDQTIKDHISKLRNRLNALEIIKVPTIKRSEESDYHHVLFTIRGIEYLAFYDEDFKLKSLAWLKVDFYEQLREITRDLYTEIIDMIIRTHLETKK
jgi:hypothetical protein